MTFNVLFIKKNTILVVGKSNFYNKMYNLKTLKL